MKWNKYTIKTIEDAEDIVSATLWDVGVEGVEIEDKRPLSEDELKGMFVDIDLLPKDDDNIAYISFYLDSDKDNSPMLNQIREALSQLTLTMDLGELSLLSSQTEDKDWINNWKEHFHQFNIEDILIVPSWEEPKLSRDVSLILHMDPGTAFGTGMHETTRLCVRALKKYVKKNDRILDIGTGSGILGIVALKYGACHVDATDLDECTVNAVKENKESNSVQDRDFDLYIGNIIDNPLIQNSLPDEGYDVITANILADVLISLVHQAYRKQKPGGILIASGILSEKSRIVREAFTKAGYEVIEENIDGEWVGIVARKNNV